MLYLYFNLILIGIFLFLGLFLLIKTTGYKYIGMSLIFIAVIDLFFSLCSVLSFSWIPILRIVVRILLGICIIYFCFVELRILLDSKVHSTDSFDYIIVHGAKVHGSTPSPALLDRLEVTLNYLQTHHTSVAILTGSKWPYADVSEAQCMFNWLTARGIPENRLIIEEQSTNTLENLRYSTDVIKTLHPTGVSRVGLLTSDYHMHRVLYMARAECIDCLGISVPTSRRFIKINYFIREAFAMTEIYLFGVEGL